MRHAPIKSRRGMAIAVIVVVLAVLSLAVAGSVRPVIHETDASLLRVQTLRAFYAAESGFMVYAGTIGADLDPPESGDSIAWPEQTVLFVQIPDGAGTAKIAGTSGGATRELNIQVE